MISTDDAHGDPISSPWAMPVGWGREVDGLHRFGGDMDCDMLITSDAMGDAGRLGLGVRSNLYPYFNRLDHLFAVIQNTALDLKKI